MHLVAKIFSLGHLFDKAVQSYKELGANQQERPKEDIVKGHSGDFGNERHLVT